MSAILYSSRIGPVAVEIIIRESHTSSLGITQIPIETGAKITDHAFKEPKQVEVDFADGGAAATWAALVRFQEQREPFTMVTGLFQYKNMLIKDLTAERDQETFRIVKGTALLQEVLLVKTAHAAGDKKADGNGKPKEDGKTPDRTEPTTPRGDQPSVADKPNQSAAHAAVFGQQVTPAGTSAGGTAGSGQSGQGPRGDQ
jgi:hypothetical protein